MTILGTNPRMFSNACWLFQSVAGGNNPTMARYSAIPKAAMNPIQMIFLDFL